MKRRNCMLAVTAALALSGCVMLPPPPPFHPPPPPQAFRPPAPLPEGGGAVRLEGVSFAYGEDW